MWLSIYWDVGIWMPYKSLYMYKFCESVLIEFRIVIASRNKTKFPEFEHHWIEHHRIDSMVECANDGPQQAFVVDDFML